MKGTLFVYQGGEGEIEEKKSRFIAHVHPVSSEEEALQFLAQMRKQYWDARHNCYAYVIGDKHQLQRCSDDGEPAGTAGRPILDILLREDVHDCCLVVTRYFGGTLLGTGGLVRAYQKAAQAGLERSVLLRREAGVCIRVRTDYGSLGKLQYSLSQAQIPVTDSRYADTVELDIVVPAEKKEELLKELLNCTGGAADFSMGETQPYTIYNGNVIFL